MSLWFWQCTHASRDVIEPTLLVPKKLISDLPPDKPTYPLWTDPAGPLSRPSRRARVYNPSQSCHYSTAKCTTNAQHEFARHNLKTF